jgi:hypothetical protein
LLDSQHVSLFSSDRLRAFGAQIQLCSAVLNQHISYDPCLTTSPYNEYTIRFTLINIAAIPMPAIQQLRIKAKLQHILSIPVQHVVARYPSFAHLRPHIQAINSPACRFWEEMLSITSGTVRLRVSTI